MRSIPTLKFAQGAPQQDDLKVRHRGVCKVDWIFTFACAAYNLVRIRNLAAAVPAV